MESIVAFGEIMMRLSPPGYQRIGQATSYNVTFGGAEANACVMLSRFGINTSYVTKLPENPHGDACVQSLRGLGVGVDGIVRGGDRIGVYYCEKGASSRPPKVLYDRKGSSIAQADSSDFDWEHLLKGADAFYFTGITPALSPPLADIVYEACVAARRAGLFIVCDMNYRSALWNSGRAAEAMSGLLPFADLIMAGIEDAALLGFSASSPEEAAVMLAERFSARRVASSLRESLSASDNILSGLLYDAKTAEIFKAREYPVHIVDRVGGGDAFSASMVYACMRGLPGQEAVELAAASSALAHTTEGDFPYFSADEARALAAGEGSGRIVR